ncbi:tRNA1(Val) (adenine(37)-N6)-methyltransferase [Chondrinema litorale]|uniref:tRNA1(Val) (adenine(37)-N6)-methyltransferase n=1 Tax=Chondrinema litorale TaxID=2994555 RepID=UPI002543B361|nr:methyltransferase [Chondrinema litorale]UZR93764.1 methyltransferase [Chondrinema litorale]
MQKKPAKPFIFKEFVVHQEKCSLKVNTDGCLLGAVTVKDLQKNKIDSTTKLLDIGTGTGVIALMLAQKFEADIDAVEIDRDSAQQAITNFEQSKWYERLNCFHNNIEDYAKESTNRYEVIVCNPPFFENATKSPYVHKNLSKHNDSLPFKTLIKAVETLLTPKGKFYIILPTDEANRFIQLLPKYSLYINYQLSIKPISYKKAHRIILIISPINQQLKEDEFSIRNEDSSFSEDYSSLLRDYYIVF